MRDGLRETICGRRREQGRNGALSLTVVARALTGRPSVPVYIRSAECGGTSEQTAGGSRGTRPIAGSDARRHAPDGAVARPARGCSNLNWSIGRRKPRNKNLRTKNGNERKKEEETKEGRKGKKRPRERSIGECFRSSQGGVAEHSERSVHAGPPHETANTRRRRGRKEEEEEERRREEAEAEEWMRTQ